MSNRKKSDSAIIAAEAVEQAQRSLLAISVSSAADELDTKFVLAQRRLDDAETAFADAVPVSLTGAMLKLRALGEMLDDGDRTCETLEMRHVRTLLAFVELYDGRRGGAGEIDDTHIPQIYTA